MRIVPTLYLKPGMIVGKNLYDNHNSLLLSRGHVLSEREIIRIMNLKYQIIYISDGRDDEEILENSEPISDALRNKAVVAIKDLFSKASFEKTLSKKAMEKGERIVDDIVNEIIINKDVTYTMTDLKLFDSYTYYHSVNVIVIAVILGVALGLSKSNLYKLGLGALMHDIGKIFVPKYILEKQDRLSSEEFEAIKHHSISGYEYLKQVKNFPAESSLAVLTHHEKYGGGGYPDGLNGTTIPLFGRILSVADVFDALISDRPYRKALPPSEAVEYIIGGSELYFDPKIVNVFIERISPYPVGTCVILSNGEKGYVVENQPKCGLRPKIRVLKDSGAVEYYDLSRGFYDITITGITYL